MMLSRGLLILSAIFFLSLLGCKAAEENSDFDGNGNMEKPSDPTQAQKNNALASRVYIDIKTITPIAMTDDVVTVRVAYSFNQGPLRTRQITVPIKKGEAVDRDFSDWLGTTPGAPRMEALIYRSRVQYDVGDMFGFSFQVEKANDGSNQRRSQSMVKAFISEAGNRPSLQVVKAQFEFPAKTELRTWLNE